MQKQKTGKISIFSPLGAKLESLAGRVGLTQFPVGSSRVGLKIWATRLESGWKCGQLDFESSQIQNVNPKLDSTISLYMLHHLMTLFAVTLWVIHVWNISRVQINIQIYAFDFDVHCKNAFCFLKIIMHLYHFITQMQSLCWNCINICNAFSVLFSLLISLIFVILYYCNAITYWSCYREK